MQEQDGAADADAGGTSDRTDNADRTGGRTGGADSGSFSRRSVLKTGAMAAGGLVFGTGVASANTDSIPSRLRDEFDRVINVVDAGADDSGSESINDVLDSLRRREELQNGTLLYFPPGRYYMDRKFRMTGFEHFGMYGNDATIVPADYYDNEDDQHKLFRLGVSYNPGKRLVVENFTVDQTADITGVRSFEAAVSDRLEVRDVDVVGRHDSGAWGPARFVLTDSDGTGLVERFTARGGGAYTPNAPHDKLWRGPSGLICNTYNEGQMTFRDCELGGFPDNGLYVAGSNGQIRVEGGTYKNSNGANVRLGGPDSYVVGADVVVDKRWSETSSQRGIRVEKSNNITVKNNRVRIATDTPNSHGLSIQSDVDRVWVQDTSIVMDSPTFNHAVCVAPRAGDVTFYKTDVELNTPGGSAFYIEGEGTDDEHAMLAQVDITGDAGHKWNRAAIYNQRDNVEFRVVSVDQIGGEKRRALENFGDNCMVYMCEFRTPWYPFIDTASGTWVEENSFAPTTDMEGVRLTDTTDGVYLKRNVIGNGIRDEGCSGLRTLENTIE